MKVGFEHSSLAKRLLAGFGSVFLLAGILLSVGLQVHRVYSLNTLSHDDSIAYLAATGHQGEYAHSMPAERWVAASEWKRFWQIDRLFPFLTIREDLARYDIHPPLYFWLLNLWLTAFGTQLVIAPLLNVALLTAAGTFLFLLARRVLRSGLWAGLLVLLWLQSPVTLQVAVETRPYALVAVWTLVLVLMIVLWWEGRSPRWVLFGVAACTAGGLLTHYHFALVLAGASMALVVRAVVERNVRLAAFPLIAMLAGVGAFVLFHPHFWDSFRSFSRQVQSAVVCDQSEISSRISKTTETLMGFMLPDTVRLTWPVVAAAAGLLVVATIVRRGKSPDWRNSVKRVAHSHLPYVVGLGIGIALAVSLLYVTCSSPRHAMSAKYLIMAFPLLAFVPFAMVTGVNQRVASALLVILLAWQVGYGISDTLEYSKRMKDQRESAVQLSAASSILLDSTARGVVPSILMHVPDSTPVYVAYQDDLLETPERFLDGIHTGSVFISELTYGRNSAEKRDQVLEILRRAGLDPQTRAGGIFDVGEAYDILPGLSP
jgi:hypothetical protein